MTESIVVARSKVPGLILVSDVVDKKLRFYAPAHGIADVCPDVPFKIRVANFGISRISLQKGMIIGVARPASDFVYSPPDGKVLKQDGIETVRTPPPVADSTDVEIDHPNVLLLHDGSLQTTNRHTTTSDKLTVTSAVTSKTTPWTDRLNIGSTTPHTRRRLVETLTPFEFMWF